MNREKILDIATKLPREAYIDLLCAGAHELWEESTISVKDVLIYNKNISYNQAKALIEAYRDEGKEEEDE